MQKKKCMPKKKRWKQALALLLTASMVATPPVQFMPYVQAAEVQEEIGAISDVSEKMPNNNPAPKFKTYIPTSDTTIDNPSEIIPTSLYKDSEFETITDSITDPPIAEETANETNNNPQETEIITTDTTIEDEQITETITEENMLETEILDDISTEENTIQETSEQDTTISNTSEQDSSEQNSSEQEDSSQNTTEQDNSEQDTSEPNISEQETTEQKSVIETFISESTEEALTEGSTQLDNSSSSERTSEDSIPLSLGINNNIIIRREDERKTYSFVPEEDGVYVVKLSINELDNYDFYYNISGIANPIYLDDRSSYITVFQTQAKNTIYLYPHVDEYVWEDYELTEVNATFDIQILPNSISLSSGTNDNLILSKDANIKVYSFTPEADGIYMVKLSTDKVNSNDFYCSISGEREDIYLDDSSYFAVFHAKAQKTIYFYLNIYDDVWEDIALDTVNATFEILTPPKGTVISNGENNEYTLTYKDTEINLNLKVFGTTIQFSISKKDSSDTNSYHLYAYINRSSSDAYISNNNYYSGYFDDLDINEDYHLYYMLYNETSETIVACFDGTGMPFDVSTKTDKVGGEIINVTADFASITVNYTLFNVDTAGHGGYIRYRKNTEEEWNYNQVSQYGNTYIINAESETTYIIELVSRDKKIIYDSTEITTEKYTSNVAIDIGDSINSHQRILTITGFNPQAASLSIETEYTDSFGELQKSTSTYQTSELKTGKITYRGLNNLEANTEYQDIKVKIFESTKVSPESSEYYDKLVYSGTLQFTTEKSKITKENIYFENIQYPDQKSIKIPIKVEGIPTNETGSLQAACWYRRKGTSKWLDGNLNNSNLTSNINTTTVELCDLIINTYYELKYNIDGITGIYEFQFIPEKFTGSVTPEIKVTNSYVNGLDVECTLKGAVDSNDNYTCRFEVMCHNDDNDYWCRVTPNKKLPLDTTKPLIQSLFSENIRPGQKQTWRYTIYKNNTQYCVGYFENESKPLDLDILSITHSSYGNSFYINYKAKNQEDIFINNDMYNFNINTLVRQKGDTEWALLKENNYLSFYKDSNIDTKVTVYPNSDFIIKPYTTYELRLVNYWDNAIIYGESTFTPESEWNIYNIYNFTYNTKTNNKQYISISYNFSKPSVEVEDESILSIKDIRQTRIYLDIHTIGTTKLYITADGITQTTTVTVSPPNIPNLYYLEGADTSLADIKLPEQFQWVDSSISPKADDANPKQYFDITYQETKDSEIVYGSIPVSVGKLGTIEIKGSNTIGAGKTNSYGVYYKSIGSDVNFYNYGKAYEITQTWSGNDNLKITGTNNERNVTVTGGTTSGTYDLTVSVTVTNLQSGKSTSTAITQTKPIRLIGAGLIDNLMIHPAKEQPVDAIAHTVSGSIISGTIIYVDYEVYEQDKDKKSKILLEAETNTKTETGETIPKKADVKWSSETTDILDVNDNGLVTVKGMGDGQLLVSSKDEGQYTTPVIFKIYKNAPFFERTAYVVNHGDTNGTKLAFHVQNNNTVTNIKIADENSPLEIYHPYRYSAWCIRTKRGSTYSEEKTEQITLDITTEKKQYSQTLTITVLPMPKANADIIAFNQVQTPNLFFADAEAIFEVNSYGYDIEYIQTPSADLENNTTNFYVKKFNSATGLLTLNANNLSQTTVSEYARKNSPYATANLEVKLKGYSEPIKYENIKIAVQNKPITLKTEEAFVTGSGVSETAIINVLNSKNPYNISGCSIKVDTLTVTPSAQKDKLQIGVDNGQLKLTYTGNGTAKYTFYAVNPNWTKDIKISGKITKVDIKKLSLKASKTKATINIHNDITIPETAQIDFSVKGNCSLPIVLKHSCTPESDALKIEADKENKKITISTDKEKSISPRKYTIKVWGEINGQATKQTKLTITVTDKIPTFKLSAKGSINLANRDISGVAYTAAIKNTDAEISKVKITDSNMLRFSVKKNSGKKFTVKALKTANDLQKNQKYTIKLRLTLSNGYQFPVDVTVKPTIKLPKLKVSVPKKPTLELQSGKTVSLRLNYDKGYVISDAKLTSKNSEYFTITMNGQNALAIRLADDEASLPPKIYSLKYQIYIAGADNTKPITKNIKITVK